MPDLSYLPQIALSGIAVGCIYGLIGIGFCVIYNASGIVNFAQGAFVMMGGMIAYSALNGARLAFAGCGCRRHRCGRGRWRHHRAHRGAAAVGSQGDHVRDDPGDAGGADRDRAPGADRRRRPAENLAAVLRPAADPARRCRRQLPVPLDRRDIAAADRPARSVLQADQDRQGDARLRLQSRGGVASGHQRLADAVAVVRAVGGRSAPSPAC